MVGEAARTGNLHADDLMVAGSPGMHVDNVAGLKIDPRHVWAGAAAGDPVGQAGWGYLLGLILPGGPGLAVDLDLDHGISPTQEAFGANQYSVDGYTALSIDAHTHYWDPDSASLKNQAAVIAGQYNRVTLLHGQAPPNIS